MYQVIARKYRPQSFEDVVNQEHVKQTLINALTQGRVGHGYIFSGPRGTGKTTMARILAKALNCENGPGATPCQECSSCREITAGNSMDLVEIDAASNRRIDDIRELRENVRYRPVRDRHKVFIIDEAHQITADAFNALLKTLEEPPEWVVFILCTTEPQQFPATIVSRCQSFPFRTVEMEDVVGRLQWICEKEGVSAEPDALVAIALAGDGSIRDSLSTLDQAIASFGQKLEAGPVRDLLGAIPSEIAEKILEALRDQDPAAMLGIVDRLAREGRHLQHFCGELTRYFRNLLVIRVSGADTRLVASGPEERKRLTAWAEQFSPEDLTRYLNLLVDLYRDMQNAPQPRFRLEIGLLKLVHAGRLHNIEKVLAQYGPGSGPGNETTPRRPNGGGGTSAAPSGTRAGNGAAQVTPSGADAVPSAATEHSTTGHLAAEHLPAEQFATEPLVPGRLAAAAAAGVAGVAASAALGSRLPAVAPVPETAPAPERPPSPEMSAAVAPATQTVEQAPSAGSVEYAESHDSASTASGESAESGETLPAVDGGPAVVEPAYPVEPAPAVQQTPPVETPAVVEAPAVQPSAPAAKGELAAQPKTGTTAPPWARLRQQLADVLRGQGDDALADALDHGRIEVQAGQVEVRSLPDYRAVVEMDLATLQQAVRDVLAPNARVTLGSDLAPEDSVPPPGSAGGSRPAAGGIASTAGSSEAAQRALADPEVQKIQKLFTGQIREVRNLRGYTT